MHADSQGRTVAEKTDVPIYCFPESLYNRPGVEPSRASQSMDRQGKFRNVRLRSVYADADSASDAEEEFFNALALLRSTEEDSAEKLRGMLDASIERKFGPERTLVARMPRHTLPSRRTRRESTASRRTSSEEAEDRRMLHQESRSFSIAEIVPLDDDAGKEIREMYEIDVEDHSDRGDIPRISIPDEGSADGVLLCKVCSGAKLGPLILLECQECQDVYHPLCHHPPVVDIDVYDPRLVWRCRKCIDASDAASATRQEKKAADKFGPIGGEEHGAGTDSSPLTEKGRKKSSNYFRKNGIHFDGRRAKDLFRGRGLHMTRPAKECSRNLKAPQGLTSSQKCATSSIAQSRKRIGSKLSVSRTSAKSSG